MVWETREVRGEVNHSRFISLHLLQLMLPTKLENAPENVPPTYTAHKKRHPLRRQCSPHPRHSRWYLLPKR